MHRAAALSKRIALERCHLPHSFGAVSGTVFALLLLADKNSRRLELLGFVNNEAVSSGECFIFNTDRMSCQFQEETWLDVALSLFH